MTTKEIADKLWRLCDVLRDDGITFHQYLNELPGTEAPQVV